MSTDVLRRRLLDLQPSPACPGLPRSKQSLSAGRFSCRSSTSKYDDVGKSSHTPPLARSSFFVRRRPEDSTGVLLAPAMSYHIPPTLSSGAGQKITCSCLPFPSVDFPSRVVLDLSCTRPGTMRSTPRRHYLPFTVILGSNILLYLRFISKISPRKVRSDTYHIRMS